MNNGLGYRFDEKMKVCCDVLMFTKCVLESNGVIYDDCQFYHYYIRDNSLFHCTDLNKRNGRLLAYEKVLELMDEYGVIRDVTKWVKRFYAYHASVLLQIAIDQKYNTYVEKLQSELAKYFGEYAETNAEYQDRINNVRNLLEYKI